MQQKLESLLGVHINNISLYELALTHRSAVNEAKELSSHNERLEFLGDAVLELIVTDYLFQNYPKLKEGDLTNLRASLVRGDTLAEIAKELGFGDFLRVSRGEEIFGGRQKNSILANTVEAVIGALYLDIGYDAAKKMVHDHLIPKLQGIIQNGDFIDAKSQFQQVAQSDFKMTPHYKEMSSSGPDHEKIFEVAVFIGEKEYGRGTGSSKQLAQQSAAKNALLQLGVSWNIFDLPKE